MSKKPVSPQMPRVLMESEVARQIRQHSRTSMKSEVCGVLIGKEDGNRTIVEACIAGDKAEQGGAHVTFTQDTWEHVYQIKDAKYPNDRIVGWYHSHPGFGVFLSDHDLFIHQNFFSSPQQIAWVYDPQNDEEGCFGWHDDKIEKIDNVSLSFHQACDDAGVTTDDDEQLDIRVRTEAANTRASLWRDVALCLLFFLAGAVGTYYFISSKAHLILKDEHALIIVDGDKIGIIPPQIAQQVLNEVQRQMDAINPFINPPVDGQQRSNSGAPGNPKGGQDGSKR